MKPIKFRFGPYGQFDHSGNPRWYGYLPDGTKAYRSQLIMMNHLHCAKIPNVFNVHHRDENTENDTISNLLLIGSIAHKQHHNPKSYDRYGISRTEDKLAYQRAMRSDPEYRTKYLAKRKENYHTRFKYDPIYVEKNRKRAHDYYHNKTKGE